MVATRGDRAHGFVGEVRSCVRFGSANGKPRTTLVSKTIPCLRGWEVDAHVYRSRNGAPAPDALPERRVDCEHGHPPEEREQCSAEENGEVREEPRPGRNGCAVGGDTGLVVEETGDHEYGNDERS